MQKTYIVVSVADFKDINGVNRTVHSGIKNDVTPSSGTNTVVSYTFEIMKATPEELASYDVGKTFTMTIQPE